MTTLCRCTLVAYLSFHGVKSALRIMGFAVMTSPSSVQHVRQTGSGGRQPPLVDVTVNPGGGDAGVSQDFLHLVDGPARVHQRVGVAVAQLVGAAPKGFPAFLPDRWLNT